MASRKTQPRSSTAPDLTQSETKKTIDKKTDSILSIISYDTSTILENDDNLEKLSKYLRQIGTLKLNPDSPPNSGSITTTVSEVRVLNNKSMEEKTTKHFTQNRISQYLDKIGNTEPSSTVSSATSSGKNAKKHILTTNQITENRITEFLQDIGSRGREAVFSSGSNSSRSQVLDYYDQITKSKKKGPKPIKRAKALDRLAAHTHASMARQSQKWIPNDARTAAPSTPCTATTSKRDDAVEPHHHHHHHHHHGSNCVCARHAKKFPEFKP